MPTRTPASPLCKMSAMRSPGSRPWLAEARPAAHSDGLSTAADEEMPMSELEAKAVRGGARAARRAARSAPLPDNLRPVRPGMPGGRYRPLSDADVLRIHRAALEILETIGLADAPPSGIEYMTRAGAQLNAA